LEKNDYPHGIGNDFMVNI